MNPDTEQHGYHARHVTKEQEARAEALVRRMAPGHAEAILTALGLLEPPPAPEPEPAPVDVCKRGHPWTPENTKTRMKGGYPCRECRACIRDRYQAVARPDTHCRNGHELTPENTTWDSEGTRRCRECQREANRRANHRRREQRRAKREAEQQGAR